MQYIKQKKYPILLILVALLASYFIVSYLKKKYAEGSSYLTAKTDVALTTTRLSEELIHDIKHSAENMHEVNFDQDMGISVYIDYKHYFRNPEGKKFYDFFKQLYDNNKPSKQAIPLNSIPKIIHQIWPGKGGKSLPAKYIFYQNTIKKLHPNWEYILWDEEKIQAEEFPDIDLYNTTRTYAEKADIARYMILKKYGGLYLDMDTFCLKSFDNIIGLYSFFAGIEPNNNVGYPHLINALIAAEPNHKVINRTLELIRKGWVESEEKYERALLPGMDAYWLVRVRTFMPFDQAFKETIELNNRDVIAFPPTYFYPLYFGKKFFSYIRPYSYTYHDFEKVDSNITYINFGYWARGLKIQDSQQQTKLENYKFVFERKFPDRVSYKANNAIPNVLYTKEKNIAAWKKYYSNLEIRKIDVAEVAQDQSLQYIELLDLAPNDEEKQLLAGLILLYNQGGVFARGDLYPIRDNKNTYMQNLLELNNKYDFYGYLENKEGLISVSSKFFGVSPGSYLIEKALEDVKHRADGKVYEAFDLNVYKYLYLGNNIVFPEIYFEENEESY